MEKENINRGNKLDVGIISSIESYPKSQWQEEKSAEVFKPRKSLFKNAYVKSMKEYKQLYKESIENPESFWRQIASEFYFLPTEKCTDYENAEFNYNFHPVNGPVYTNFMKGMKTNICYNVLDRHVEERGDKTAFFWEGNDAADHDSITYSELFRRVCVFANGLKCLGVEKGDIVVIFMPTTIETVVAMLACVRIGAVHSLTFAGYSAQSLADRLVDGKVKVLITADGFWRGEKLIALKEICDKAIVLSEEQGHTVEHCVVLNYLSRLQSTQMASMLPKKMAYATPYLSTKDKWWHEVCAGMSEICPPEWVDSEHPMFILYTSGSTGKPKGIVHSTGGYLIFATTNFKYSFEFHAESGDVMWGTPDLAWCAGHTNVVYGPLSLGGTSVLFDGSPFHPSITRPWEIIQKYGVTHFYTAPTLIRHLMKSMKASPGSLGKFKRNSLRVLGTVGEPISPEVWLWYYQVFGRSRCPIVDTYGQTETGGHVLTSLAAATPMKPGVVGLPFFGVIPILLSKEGEIIEGEGEGCLVFSQPWPCIARAVHGDEERYRESYFTKFPGYYNTGDAVRRDADGYFCVTGRADDMFKVSGRLISSTRIESAVLEHPAIADAAIVPVPHEIKGQCIHAFVILKDGFQLLSRREILISEVKQKVSQKLGSFATPDVIWVSPTLPRTRSGKVLRRVLPLIATGKSEFGDISALADVTVLQTLAHIVTNDGTTKQIKSSFRGAS